MAKLRRLNDAAKRDQMLCRRINRGWGGREPLSLLKSAEVWEIRENWLPQRLGRIEPADADSLRLEMRREWEVDEPIIGAKVSCEVNASRHFEPDFVFTKRAAIC